jgi:hypothetical protein
MEFRKCELCKKTLNTIGLQRLNGKLLEIDWTRKYHKCCYREVQLLKRIEDEILKHNLIN